MITAVATQQTALIHALVLRNVPCLKQTNFRSSFLSCQHAWKITWAVRGKSLAF